MAAEDHKISVGDQVLLRSGPSAGQEGEVASINSFRGQNEAGPLVMVKLKDGRINTSYLNNLQRVKGSKS